MVRRSHDTHHTGQHKPGSCPTDDRMPLFSDAVDEEERSMLNLRLFNQSLTTVNISDEPVKATNSCTTGVDIILPTLCPPVTRMHLMMMEERATPPSLEICHELVFDGKAKIGLQHVKDGLDEHASSSNEYWTFLQRELDSLHGGAGEIVLLPQLIGEIKNMLLYLYPESKVIGEHLIAELEPTLLVQDLRQGNVKVASLAENLARILKANCAPKRDALTDHLAALGRAGNWMGLLRCCLDLMELMKLDLINYRLLQNRRLIVRSIVSRERIHFFNLIDHGKMDISITRNWLENHQRTLKSHHETVDIIRGAFVDLLLMFADNGSAIPETFILDVHRIHGLRSSLQDIGIVASSLLIGREWLGGRMDLLGELKLRMVRALAFPEAKVSDLAGQILLVAGRARGSPIRGQQRQLLCNAIDKIIDPNHKVYQVMKEKMKRLLLANLNDHVLTIKDLKWAGLSAVIPEMEHLLGLIKSLWILHWHVHKDRYERLIAEIKV